MIPILSIAYFSNGLVQPPTSPVFWKPFISETGFSFWLLKSSNIHHITCPNSPRKCHFRTSHQLCLLSTTVGWFVRPQRSPIFLEICWLFLGMNRWKNLNFKCLKFQFSFYHGKSKSNYPNATPDHGAQPSLNKALFVGVNVALGGVNVPYVPGKYP